MTWLFNLVFPHRWVLVGVLLGFFGGALGVQTVRVAHYEAKFADAKSLLAAEKQARAEDIAAHANQRAADEKQARATEHQLQEAADQAAQQRDKALSDLAARSARVAASLRNRPEARSTYGSCAPAPASAPVGCTGAGLSRPDAEVALWFASRAAKHAAERDACYRIYNDARSALTEGQTK